MRFGGPVVTLVAIEGGPIHTTPVCVMVSQLSILPMTWENVSPIDFYFRKGCDLTNY